MRRFGVRSLIIWALICFGAPLLLLPVYGEWGETPAWTRVGLNDHQIISLTMDAASADWLYASSQGAGIWRMHPADAAWHSASAAWHSASAAWHSASAGLRMDRWSGATITEIVFLPTTPMIAFGMDAHGVLYRSFDGGRVWDRVDSPSSSTRSGLLAASRAGTLYLAVSSLVYHSNDAGQTWSDAELLPDGMEATCLAADLPTRGALLVGARSGQILHTLDGGASWQADRSARSSTRIRAFAGVEDGPLYAATASGLLRSLDGGAHWQPASPALQGQDILALLADGDMAQAVYAGLARGGVYYSLDGGESWSRLGHALTHRSVTALALDSARQTLFAASDAGVWAYAAPVTQFPSPTDAPPPTSTVTPTATSTPTPSLTSTPPAATRTATSQDTVTFTPRPTRTLAPVKSRTPTTTRTTTRTATMTREPTAMPTRSVTPTLVAPATASATAPATATPAIDTATPAPPQDTPQPPETAEPPATTAPPTVEPPSPTPPR
jgi:photosystem II stability/assembly factor-like uncharacterized protein